jgi:hypothetical protein
MLRILRDASGFRHCPFLSGEFQMTGGLISDWLSIFREHLPEMDKSSITDWIEISFIVVGGLVALVQYLINSRHEKAVKAADEMDALSRDESVKLVMRMLDWSASYIFLKDGIRGPREILADEQVFLLALRPHGTRRNTVENYTVATDLFALERMDRENTDWEQYFSRDEHSIRDAFDVFLSCLERIESLIKKGIISQGR